MARDTFRQLFDDEQPKQIPGTPPPVPEGNRKVVTNEVIPGSDGNDGMNGSNVRPVYEKPLDSIHEGIQTFNPNRFESHNEGVNLADKPDDSEHGLDTWNTGEPVDRSDATYDHAVDEKSSQLDRMREGKDNLNKKLRESGFPDRAYNAGENTSVNRSNEGLQNYSVNQGEKNGTVDTPSTKEQSNTQPTTPRRELRRGHNGEDVKELQRSLKIADDGKFGPKTEEAVKKFQRAHGLDETGIVDEATWQKLYGEGENNGGGNAGGNAGGNGANDYRLTEDKQIDHEGVEEFDAGGVQAKGDGYDWIMSEIARLSKNGGSSETPEQKAAREKREKRNRRLAAIGDGLSALANLYFTTKGAPSMYDGSSSLAGTLRERYEKMTKEREASDRNHMSDLARMAQLMHQRNTDEYQAAYKQGILENQRYKADLDKQYKDRIAELNEWKNQQDAKYKDELAKIKARDQEWKEQHTVPKGSGGKTSGKSSRKTGKYYKRGTGGGSKTYGKDTTPKDSPKSSLEHTKGLFK